MAMDKNTPSSNSTELSDWIISLVRSPEKSRARISYKKTKQPEAKPIATNQPDHPKLFCPSCGKALTLSKSALRKARRHGKKVSCPACGPVSLAERPRASTKTPLTPNEEQRAKEEAISGHSPRFTPYEGLPPWRLPGSFGTGKRR